MAAAAAQQPIVRGEENIYSAPLGASQVQRVKCSEA